LSPAGNPRIEPQSVDEGQDLTYVATFEVFPEVALQPLDSLEIERVTAEVTESDIDAMIERLRKQQMRSSHGGSRAAATGDKVTIDFEGAIDGVAFAGGKGENVAIVLGEGACCRNSKQGLIGAVRGRERDRGMSISPPITARRSWPARANFKARRQGGGGAGAAGAR
jgi:trigger factor